MNDITDDPCVSRVRDVLGAADGSDNLNPKDYPQLAHCVQCGLQNGLPYCVTYPFHAAAMMGELTALRKAALGRAADWRSEYDSRGFTPLHCAVHKGKDKVVAWLLSIGADPDAVVSMPDGSPLENVPGNVTSLYMATCLHDVIRSRLVSLLLKSGADPNHPAARDPVHGITSLHNAAFFGELSAVRALLKHGADAQALSLTGDTPATCASKGAAYASSPHGEISVWPGVGLFRHSHFQIAELLEKRAGAQPSTEDDGDNPQA